MSVAVSVAVASRSCRGRCVVVVLPIEKNHHRDGHNPDGKPDGQHHDFGGTPRRPDAGNQEKAMQRESGGSNVSHDAARQCTRCQEWKHVSPFRFHADASVPERRRGCRDCFADWLDEQWALDQVQPRQS